MEPRGLINYIWPCHHVEIWDATIYLSLFLSITEQPATAPPPRVRRLFLHLPLLTFTHLLYLSLIKSLSFSLSLSNRKGVPSGTKLWPVTLLRLVQFFCSAQFPLSLSIYAVFFLTFFSSKKAGTHSPDDHPYTTKFTVSNFYIFFLIFLL
jgi:hypothetical protein